MIMTTTSQFPSPTTNLPVLYEFVRDEVPIHQVDLNHYGRLDKQGLQHSCLMGWTASIPFFKGLGLRLHTARLFHHGYVSCSGYEVTTLQLEAELYGVSSHAY